MPGQKVFQPGMTLMQAILAAGGVSQGAKNIIELGREDEKGRVTTVFYVLKDIKSGKIPNPRLQPGDLIEVK